jgi:uncharacterized protein (TIGR02117 family)
MPPMRLLLLVLSVGSITGCVTPVKGLFPPASGAAVQTVYVVREGCHTGLVFRRSDLALTNMVGSCESPSDDYVEFGWGEASYYPSKHPTISMGLKAGFWPSPSVLKAQRICGPLPSAYSTAQIIAVELSENGFARLRNFVANSFRRDRWGNPIPAQPGFYEAKRKFYLLHTCNWWTALALRSAGLPIEPGCCLTADCVIELTRKFGKVIR